MNNTITSYKDGNYFPSLTPEEQKQKLCKQPLGTWLARTGNTFPGLSISYKYLKGGKDLYNNVRFGINEHDKLNKFVAEHFFHTYYYGPREEKVDHFIEKLKDVVKEKDWKFTSSADLLLEKINKRCSLLVDNSREHPNHCYKIYTQFEELEARTSRLIQKEKEKFENKITVAKVIGKKNILTFEEQKQALEEKKGLITHKLAKKLQKLLTLNSQFHDLSYVFRSIEKSVIISQHFSNLAFKGKVYNIPIGKNSWEQALHPTVFLGAHFGGGLDVFSYLPVLVLSDLNNFSKSLRVVRSFYGNSPQENLSLEISTAISTYQLPPLELEGIRQSEWRSIYPSLTFFNFGIPNAPSSSTPRLLSSTIHKNLLTTSGYKSLLSSSGRNDLSFKCEDQPNYIAMCNNLTGVTTWKTDHLKELSNPEKINYLNLIYIGRSNQIDIKQALTICTNIQHLKISAHENNPLFDAVEKERSQIKSCSLNRLTLYVPPLSTCLNEKFNIDDIEGLKSRCPKLKTIEYSQKVQFSPAAIQFLEDKKINLIELN